MKEYAVYDSSGEIVRHGWCQDDDLTLQGSLVVEGIAAPATHYVVGGVLTAYTAPQQAAKSARPMYPAQWSNVSMSWVDQRTLAQHQTSKWAAIKASRDAAVATPKTTSIGQFDADEVSQGNLNKVVALVQIAQAFGHPGVSNYTLATNARVTLTLAQLQTAALEMGSQVQALYDKADTLRTAINAATDIPTVEAITW